MKTPEPPTDAELDRLEKDHIFFGPSGCTQVVIEKAKLYALIAGCRKFNAMRDSMEEFAAKMVKCEACGVEFPTRETTTDGAYVICKACSEKHL